MLPACSPCSCIVCRRPLASITASQGAHVLPPWLCSKQALTVTQSAHMPPVQLPASRARAATTIAQSTQLTPTG